ncbi:MAG TPA: Hsp20/alpha crystallin family protein [Planctomycetota bacterium]|jgi:HSP20 family molecular chaperone IbpA|nr:Hsp20/alpha crystallin family protein [Planctomycetota bacterium]
MTQPALTPKTRAAEVAPAEQTLPTGNVIADESKDLRELVTPRTDILETSDRVLLIADMPGVDEKAVEITLEKNLLTIRGRAAWEAPADFKLAYQEFALGDYERSFRLSDEISREGIAASMKNGVLRVTLPKAEPVRHRRIEVKAE